MSSTQIAHERLSQAAGNSIFAFDSAGLDRAARLVPGELIEAADEFDNPFKLHVVRNAGSFGEASSLIERRFAWRGYSVSPLAQPSSNRITLTASVGDATVATISAGIDGAEGLYVERLYPAEVQALRDEGRRLCEFTRLAVHEGARSRAMLGAIFHVANMYVSDLHGCTDVLIEVNPRHVRFYKQMLGFEHAADQRLDPDVNAPAVLLRLDLSHSARQIAEWGGRRQAIEGSRSFYPYFFAASEAAQIEQRLRWHAQHRSTFH